jgi:hypothetical protein
VTLESTQLAAAISDPTPWWGTLVVAGVGFGGVLWTQLATARREKQRIDREQQERDRMMRVELFAEFHRVMTQFLRIANERGSGRLPKAEAAALRDQLCQAADASARVYGQLRLLASFPIQSAAGAVTMATDQYQRALQRGGLVVDELREVVRTFNAALDIMRADVNPGEPATIEHRLLGRFRWPRRLRRAQRRE